MARNDFTPTAANIIASLGIKGASVVGDATKEGYVPVLDAEGKVDISVVPVSKIKIDIATLSNTAYVDPEVDRNSTTYSPTGSIASPFSTLEEAAQSDKKFSNFILVSNSSKYKTSSPIFKTTDTIIRIFSTGTAQFDSLTLNGYSSGTQFILNNISVTGTLFAAASALCSIVLTGNGSVNTIQGAVSDQADPDVSYWYLTKVSIDPDIVVTNYKYVTALEYLASGLRIKNGSQLVKGTTVADALDSLGKRRIRIPKFSADSTGIHVSTTQDIAITDGSSYDVHNINELGQTLVDAANGTFYKKGDSPEFSDVKVETLEASSIETDVLSTVKVKFGAVPVYIDEDDFLTVGDTDSSESHAYPRYDDADSLEYPRIGSSSDSNG